MIKKIKIQGLRAKRFDLALGPLTLVIGANTAGKTTIADAIRWGLLGYIPGLDKPPRGWAELLGAGETQATVDLELAPGSVGRKLWMENGSAKVDGWAAEGFDQFNVLCLDPNKFLQATGPVRAQMVADATESGGFDWRAMVPAHLKADHFENWSTWPAWAEHALTQAKEERSMAAASKKTLAATMRGLESLRGIVIEDDAGMKKRLDEGKEKLGSLKEQLRAVTIQIANVKDAPTSQGQLDAVLRALQEFLGQTHDEDTINDRWKDLGQRTKDHEKRKPEIEADLDQLRQETALAQNAVAVNVARLEHLSMDAKAIEGKYKQLKKLKKCPTCGSQGKELTEALRLAENAETRRLADEVGEAGKESVKVEQAHKEALKRLEAAEAYSKQGLELDEERQKLEDEQQLITLWKRHDELVAEVNQQRQTYDLRSLEERRYDIECEMQDVSEANGQIELELEAIKYKRSQRKQLEEVEAQLQSAEASWEIHNKAVKEIEELRDRLSAMSLEPILSTLGRFTKGIFQEPLSLQGTELGRLIGSRWVPLNQFSGSEQAVAIVALSCALQADPDKLNLVIADELSSFDDEHLALFLENVQAAIKAKVLDQFIGFSTPRKSTKGVTKEVTTLKI